MKCSKCLGELKPVSDTPMRRYNDWTMQYERAIGISFHGGYGMFDDPITALIHSSYADRDRTAILCHNCAHQFLIENPWAKFEEGHWHDDET